MWRTEPRSPEIEEAERRRDLTVPQDAARYLKAHRFLTELRNKYLRGSITAEQYKDFRRQAVAGQLGTWGSAATERGQGDADMVISIWHLVWIVPGSIAMGLFIAALIRANGR